MSAHLPFESSFFDNRASSIIFISTPLAHFILPIKNCCCRRKKKAWRRNFFFPVQHTHGQCALLRSKHCSRNLVSCGSSNAAGIADGTDITPDGSTCYGFVHYGVPFGDSSHIDAFLAKKQSKIIVAIDWINEILGPFALVRSQIPVVQMRWLIASHCLQHLGNYCCRHVPPHHTPDFPTSLDEHLSAFMSGHSTMLLLTWHLMNWDKSTMRKMLLLKDGDHPSNGKDADHGNCMIVDMQHLLEGWFKEQFLLLIMKQPVVWCLGRVSRYLNHWSVWRWILWSWCNRPLGSSVRASRFSNCASIESLLGSPTS